MLRHLLAATVILGSLAALLLGRASAHGGEDHGEAALAAPVARPGAGVTITKEQQFALAMITEPAARMPLSRHLEITGMVIPRTDATAEVVPPVGGKVVGGRLPQLGEHVSRGQILFHVMQVLAPSERAALRSTQIAARAEQASAEREVSRLERLEGVVAGKQLTEARIRRDAAREQYKAISDQLAGSAASVAVTAPISGEITHAEIAAGEIVDGSRAVYRISDLSRVWVRANLFEKDLPRLEGAERAEVRSASLPGETIPATLYTVAGAVDPETRTIPALFLVDNTGGRLKLNMAVSVAAVTSDRTGVLAVRRDAIVKSGTRQIVFVHTAPEVFEARDVTVGESSGGDYVEVVGGLVVGERILVTGTHQLRTAAGL
jgi:RND family efflux transporter MFP subunit